MNDDDNCYVDPKTSVRIEFKDDETKMVIERIMEFDFGNMMLTRQGGYTDEKVERIANEIQKYYNFVNEGEPRQREVIFVPFDTTLEDFRSLVTSKMLLRESKNFMFMGFIRPEYAPLIDQYESDFTLDFRLILLVPQKRK